jgi:hypothetical protein
MSKQTLALIIFLTALTGFFVYLAVSQNKGGIYPSTPTQVVPTKKPNHAFTTIQLQPQAVTLSARSGSVDVMINTNGTKNKVTAVQLELSYDPGKLTNVTITPGKFIGASVPLINNTNPKTGRITYALAISPSASGKSGSGILATITFQSLMSTGMSTNIGVLPQTLVTSEGTTETVLSKATGTTITATGTPAVKTLPSVSPKP